MVHKIDKCPRERQTKLGRHITTIILHPPLPPTHILSYLLGRKESHFFVTLSEIFPVDSQSKLPFSNACLSLGSWDCSLKINLDTSLHFFPSSLYYSAEMIAWITNFYLGVCLLQIPNRKRLFVQIFQRFICLTLLEIFKLQKFTLC
jgi:hypothetical protein